MNTRFIPYAAGKPSNIPVTLRDHQTMIDPRQSATWMPHHHQPKWTLPSRRTLQQCGPHIGETTDLTLHHWCRRSHFRVGRTRQPIDQCLRQQKWWSGGGRQKSVVMVRGVGHWGSWWQCSTKKNYNNKSTGCNIWNSPLRKSTKWKTFDSQNENKLA